MVQNAVRCIAAYAAFLVISASAQAADPEKARSHADKGATLFDLQHYDEAAREYELAYEAKPAPEVLFNLGQAYRLGNHQEKAIRAYKTYLSRVPHAPNREEVQGRIAEMERQLALAAATRAKPPDGTLSPPRVNEEEHRRAEAPAWKRPLPWALVASGVAVAAVGTGLLVHSASLRNDADTANSLNAQNDLLDSSDKYRISGGVLAGVGGAALVAGVVTFFVHKREPRVGVSVSSNGSTSTMLHVGGTW